MAQAKPSHSTFPITLNGPVTIMRLPVQSPASLPDNLPRLLGFFVPVDPDEIDYYAKAQTLLLIA